jgi:hypothetical protein
MLTNYISITDRSTHETFSMMGEKATFTSSTKEGNPPIAMKVRSAVVYIITSHLDWKIGNESIC